MSDRDFRKIVELIDIFLTSPKEDFEKKLGELGFDRNRFPYLYDDDLFDEKNKNEFFSLFNSAKPYFSKVFSIRYEKGADGKVRVEPSGDESNESLERLTTFINRMLGNTLEDVLEVSSPQRSQQRTASNSRRILWGVIYIPKTLNQSQESDLLKVIIDAPQQQEKYAPEIRFERGKFSIKTKPNEKTDEVYSVTRSAKSVVSVDPHEFDLGSPEIRFNNGVFEFTYRRLPPRA